MLEIVLTREDANTEYALVAEWLVEDRSEVSAGQPVCVVETTKATVEVESPGAGTIVQLYGEEVEVELGKTIAYVAETADELASIEARAEAKPAPKPAAGDRKATRKAVELAELHGIDLASIDKRGFITEKDVEALIAQHKASETPAGSPILAGVSTDGVSLPSTFEVDESAGALDLAFLADLDHEAFRALAPGEKVRCAPRRRCPDRRRCRPRRGVARRRATNRHRGWCSARAAGDDRLRGGRRDRRALAVRSGSGARAAGARSSGAGIWGGRSVRFGGGGHRDPWATLTIGDLAFVGDEAFVNVCRPVLIGREVFLTMRSIIVTHNVGHSVLEGFENRFAPVVLEDRSQVGLGAVLYAGARVGAEAIVASNSYVVGDIPAGAFAIGVPAKATGSSSHKLSESRRARARTADDRRSPRAARAPRARRVRDRGRRRSRSRARE